MRFAVSALFACATSLALVAAQDLSGIPTCAIPCFAGAISGSGCSVTDTRCQCSTGSESIANSLNSCTPTRCSPDDVAKIGVAVQSLCAAAGVSLTNLPPSSTASGASAGVTGPASRAASATASAASAASTGAAGKVVVGYGAAVAMGLVGVLAL